MADRASWNPADLMVAMEQLAENQEFDAHDPDTTPATVIMPEWLIWALEDVTGIPAEEE